MSALIDEQWILDYETKREDETEKYESAMKVILAAIEPIIQHNREYLAYATAKKWLDLHGETAEKEARINAIVAVVSRFIHWNPKTAMRLAGDILEDVNLHDLTAKVRQTITDETGQAWHQLR